MNDELRTAQIEIAATLYAANRKPSIAVAYVALLLFGGLGLHRAYLKKGNWFVIPALGLAGGICGAIAIGDQLRSAFQGVPPGEIPEFGLMQTLLLSASAAAWIAMVALLLWDFLRLPAYVEKVVVDHENRKRVQLASMLAGAEDSSEEIQWSLDFDGFDDG
jgi:hypothetical protein